MKKLYLLIILPGFLFSCGKLFAQCSVSISTNSNITQVDYLHPLITLRANATGKGLITYSWSTGDSTSSKSVSNAGTYKVTIKDTAGCTASASIGITNDIIPPEVEIKSVIPPVICRGSSSVITATLTNASYQWYIATDDVSPGQRISNGNDPFITVTPNKTSWYYVTCTNPAGVSESEHVPVVVRPFPIPTGAISGTTTVCQDAAKPPITFTGLSGGNPFTFSYNINGGPTQAITTTGTNNTVAVSALTDTSGTIKYNLISVSDGNSCSQVQSGAATITVLSPAVLTSTKTKSICDNVSFSYTATSSAAATSFSWKRAAVGGIRNVADSGTTATIKETLNDTTSLPVDVYYVFTLSTGAGCVTKDSVKVTVNPTPLINPINDTTFCNGAFASGGIPFGSNSPNTVITWSNSDTSIGLPARGSGSIPPFNAKNSTAIPVTAIITVLIKGGNDSCTVTSTRTFKITVPPTPVLTSSRTVSICDSASFNYAATSSAAGTFFTWKRLPVGGISNISNSGTTNTINEKLYNITSQPVEVDYVFALSSGLSCFTADTVKTTVNPTPITDPIANQSYCNGSRSEGFLFTTNSPGASFTWTNSNISIGLPASGKGNILPFIVKNSTAIPITATITVSVKASADSCAGTKRTFIITVNPTPTLTPIKDTTFCNGAFAIGGIPFTSSSPGASFRWTNNNTKIGLQASDSGKNIPPFIATNTTDKPDSAIIIVFGTGSCAITNSDTFKIKVFPTPIITSTKDTSICDNTSFSYTARSSALGTSFSWTRAAVGGINNSANGKTTATINETLKNTTSLPVVVNYVFTLFTDTRCVTTDTVKVTVNPTPKIDSIASLLFCNNFLSQSIVFTSHPNNASLIWDSDTSIGFGTSGTGNIPAFITYNPGNDSIDAHINVKISTGNNCQGVSVPFTITVFPTPVLTSKKDTSVCDKVAFRYTATSYAKRTAFSWKRATVAGISNLANSSATATINETLLNTTSKPVVVSYVFTLSTGTLSTGPNCSIPETLHVTVNPTPVTDQISNYTYCNGTLVPGIRFTSSSPNPSFTWSSYKAIGFGSSGRDSIPRFTATNTSASAIVDTIKVSVTASADQCPGPDINFTITVNPSPVKPHFTSLSGTADSDTLKLCSGSENINFNINSPGSGTSYRWTTSDSSAVLIRDTIHPNTVVSFIKPGPSNYLVNAIARNSAGGCADTVSQIVNVAKLTTGIDKRKIFLMQPGNLLVYPDNSLQGYQWGYDTIVLNSLSDTAFGRTVPVPGQVYQFFNPPAQFIDSNNSLNKTKYLYSVLLQNRSCYTRVYYNGRYANRVAEPIVTDTTVQLKVFPNPNKGFFKISLKGNIYGLIDAKIYNSLGQLVLSKDFTKTIPEVEETFNTNNLPAGIYFLELRRSYLNRIVAPFVIQR